MPQRYFHQRFSECGLELQDIDIGFCEGPLSRVSRSYVYNWELRFDFYILSSCPFSLGNFRIGDDSAVVLRRLFPRLDMYVCDTTVTWELDRESPKIKMVCRTNQRSMDYINRQLGLSANNDNDFTDELEPPRRTNRGSLTIRGERIENIFIDEVLEYEPLPEESMAVFTQTFAQESRKKKKARKKREPKKREIQTQLKVLGKRKIILD